jgi:hypothetical protein
MNGKIQRSATRAALLGGTLDVVASWSQPQRGDGTIHLPKEL